MLAQIEAVAAVAPRKYHIVVLSDHGQSQGAIFADRYGEDLAALVAPALRRRDRVASEKRRGQRRAELDGRRHRPHATPSWAGPSAAPRTGSPTRHVRDPRAATERARTAAEEQFLVFGSGNLGLIYVAGEQQRLTIDELTDRFPALVPGLVAHPGVGVRRRRHRRARPGRARRRPASTGSATASSSAIDPLARFGPHAPEFVLRAATMPEAPDIYVNSLLDDLDEVAAFEGLVACHGGLGGWQDRGMVVHPVDFEMPDGHGGRRRRAARVLVGWLEELGHRTDLATTGARSRRGG